MITVELLFHEVNKVWRYRLLNSFVMLSQQILQDIIIAIGFEPRVNC